VNFDTSNGGKNETILILQLLWFSAEKSWRRGRGNHTSRIVNENVNARGWISQSRFVTIEFVNDLGTNCHWLPFHCREIPTQQCWLQMFEYQHFDKSGKEIDFSGFHPMTEIEWKGSIRLPQCPGSPIWSRKCKRYISVLCNVVKSWSDLSNMKWLLVGRRGSHFLFEL